MNDVVLNKVQSIQRCVARARAEHAAATDWAADFTRQDAAVMNVLRASERAIDLANLVIRRDRLGIPATSRESFERLCAAGIIPAELGTRMRAMVGFRNIAVHNYRTLDLEIVARVLETGLDDVLAFADTVARHMGVTDR